MTSNNNNTNSKTSQQSPSKEVVSSFGSKELDKYMLLLRSSKGTAAAALIEQVLRAHGIFSFGELLTHANIVALKSSKHSIWYNALELFAYGTLTDYISNPSKYPVFDERQILKLKQLSIVTLAAHSTSKILFYKDLQRILDVKTVRELEDMIISCIYEGLIIAKLDQRKARVEIASCKGRDIGPQALGLMKNRLLSWLQFTDVLMEQLENKRDMAVELTLRREIMYKMAQKNIERTTEMLLEKVQNEKFVSHNNR